MRKQLFNIRGMMRDLAASKGSNQYAYEIRNLRLTAQEDSTFLALTTEKGNTQYSLITEDSPSSTATIIGTIIGYCTVGNDYIVIFTHDATDGDFIYRLHESADNTMFCKCLYGKDVSSSAKDLGFTDNTKIEAIGIYENENMQKVYWIDGVNQPRVINVVADNDLISGWDSSSVCPFDFMLKMKLLETVDIVKNTNIYGIFTPGTIQYVFTYHTKMGQQTPAFYVSPIYYTSPATRGASPEDSVSNAFTISLAHLDSNFDYVDIYSIQRTSENGTPVCKKVVELKMTGSTLTYTDNGINTEIVDYSDILYLGGTNIVPYTMEQKNNVLFFGNIKYNTDYITEAQKTDIFNDSKVEFVQSTTSVSKGSDGSYYMYDNQLDKSQAEISTFMSDESYYIGIILQDEYGVWSDVIPVGGYIDGTSTHEYYERHVNNQRINDDDTTFNPVSVKVTFGDTAKDIISGYKKIKVVRLKENPSVLCQAAVSPTVFNKDRKSGNTYAQSSWVFRPIVPKETIKDYIYKHNYNIRTKFTWETIGGNLVKTDIKGEINGASSNDINISPAYIWRNSHDLSDNEFFVDWNVVTLHSPEIEYGNIQDGDYQVNLIGHTVLDTNADSLYLELNSPVRVGKGITQTNDTNINESDAFLSPLWFEDALCYNYIYESGSSSTYTLNAWNVGLKVLYPIYPWHRNGSITTQREGVSDLPYSVPKTKCFGELRCAYKNHYTNSQGLDTSKVFIYQEDSQPITIPADSDNDDYQGAITYFGEGNKLLSPYGYPLYADSDNKIYYENSSAANIHIRYKSSKHGVIQLKYGDDKVQTVLPNTISESTKEEFQPVFWSKKTPVDYKTVDSIGDYDYIVNLTIPSTDIEDGVYNSITINYGGTGYFGIAILKEFIHRYMSLAPGNYVYLNGSTPVGTGGVYVRDFLWVVVSPSEWTTGYSNIFDSNLYYYLRPVGTSVIPVDDSKRILVELINGFRKLIPYHAWSITNDSGGPYILVQWDSTVGTAGFIPHNTEYKTTISKVMGSYSTNDENYIYLTNLKATQQNLTSFVNTSWIVAGKTERTSDVIDIPDEEQGDRGTVTAIKGTIGDAYYQRFDCLKTYPYSNEDVNQVVEILSFMCETHINIDGRYDTKRGLIDNTIVNGENFNLLNKGYTQDDNAFSYSFLDAEDFDVDNFPNQLTWTKQKVFGSHIDNWTHVVATSALDMDGNRGSVTALKLWNDKLLCFQDRGVALIKYNENVAISSTTGTPIELASSNKVEGKQYISTVIGCSNKDTIQATTTGLYFADSNTREIYKYSEGLQPISKSKGFNTYFYNHQVKFDKMKAFYDPTLKDVYFRIHKNIESSVSNIPQSQEQGEQQVSGTREGDTPTPTPTNIDIETLVFNEQFEEFTSILDYDMDFMFPYKDSLISVIKSGNNKGLWKQFAGDYLKFFGTKKGYSLELLCSENPTEDKTFTNVEFRADVLNGQSLVNDNSVPSANVLPFSHVKAWNEYQNTGDVAFSKTFAANASQKFRIWRGDIPRDYVNKLDRIRNPWMKLKLYKTALTIGNTNYKTVIHDVSVSYV